MHEVVEIDFKNQKVWLSDGDQRDIASGVLLQSTGLLDKNWKEIYEWDIIKWKDNDPELRYFRCIFDQWGFKFQDLQYKTICRYWWSYCTWFIEIVGNIYENPGLLNQ